MKSNQYYQNLGCKKTQTTHRFSTIPPDHAHAQEIAKVKKKGGIMMQAKVKGKNSIVDLTKDSEALKWKISVPEKAATLILN